MTLVGGEVSSEVRLPEHDDDDDFISLLRESVLDGFDAVLGESGRLAMMNSYDFDRFIENPEHLDHLLVSVFKDTGAAVLERAIIGELFAKIDESGPDTRDTSFESCVNAARNLYNKKSSRALGGRELRTLKQHAGSRENVCKGRLGRFKGR